ncbi:MAG: hypothetical protein KC912_18930 [Proteobacteria bacterium]|nr:hypothetical protein [Pseudomonadota bacterium]
MRIAILVSLALAACSSEPQIHISTQFAATAGEVSFLLPNGTTQAVAASDLVGKPYVVSVFEGGFSQGNDDPLDLEWGTVPDHLTIDFTSTVGFEPGPYDASVIVYVNTPVASEDMQADAAFEPEAPVGGDLSAFTLDEGDILPGDPSFEAGVVRINVIDGEGDASKHLSNRTAAPDNSDALLEAFTDTILLVP